MIYDLKDDRDDMTRYRQRTRRFIILFLKDSGEASVRDIAKALDRDPRVIRNYLQRFPEDFEVTGRGRGARWKARS